MKHLFIYGFALFGLTACNLYGGVDSPSGDAQLTSAARAAFDQGNFSQALTYYKQLSTNSNDIQVSEEAEIVFNQSGATIENFAAAFGNGKNINVGSALSNFATALKPFRGATNRTAIFNAFQTYKSIHNGSLGALIQFLGSMSMAGLILAEDMGSDSTYRAVDVCPTTGVAPCSAGVLAAGTTVSGSSGDMTTASVSDFSATNATLSMFNAAMIDVADAVAAIGTTGTFGSSTDSLATDLTATSPAILGATNYRAAMIFVGIGL